jgi:hypothetical protein
METEHSKYDIRTTTERVLRTRGSLPNLIAKVGLLDFVFMFLLYYGPVIAGKTTLADLIDPFSGGILTALSVAGFLLYLPAALHLAEEVYLRTVLSLDLKDAEFRDTLLSDDAFYTRRSMAFGTTVLVAGIALVVPQTTSFQVIFPLTAQSLTVFSVTTGLLFILGLPALDAFAVIPAILRLPSELKKRNLIEIKLLEPDRCGGVKSLGDLYLFSSVLIAVAGSIVVGASGAFENEIAGYVFAAFIGIVALLVFIVPQGSVSRLMKDEKRKELAHLSGRIQKLRNLAENVDQFDEMMVTFLQVQAFIMIYNEYEKLREYPYETSTLQKVITAGLLPIVLKIGLPLIGLG